MTAWLVFDLVLMATVIWLAWTALAATDTFAAIVLFMALGLVLALAWARLGAPDVALAEAAVGAGVTGALLLRTWAALGSRREPVSAPAVRAVPAVLSLAVAGLLFGATLLPQPDARLEGVVTASLTESGVENPVTAVLLNFRAYDTLLEVLVLFAAAVLVTHLSAAATSASRQGLGPIFFAFLRFAVPPLVLVAGYLLWIGAMAPGGAFQAGALLGAAGILLLVGGVWRPGRRDLAAARIAVSLGVAGFGIAGALAWAAGGAVLQYPVAEAKAWILAIEALVALSTAATLVGLFHGLSGSRRRA